MTKIRANSFWKLLLLFLLCIKNSSTSLILEMDGETLRELIETQEIVVLEFYVPWCEHCKTFKPEFEKLFHKVDALDSSIILAKIDSEKHKQVAKYFEISAYPTIVMFFQGEPIFYQGQLALNDVYHWIKDLIVREPAEVTTDEAFESLRTNMDTIVLFAGLYTHPSYNSVRLAAKKTPDVHVFSTTLDHVYKQYNIVEGDFVHLDFKRNETVLFAGRFNSDHLKNFMYIQRIGHLIKFDSEKLTEIVLKRIPILCLFGTEEDETLERWVDELRSGFQSHMIAIKLDNRYDKDQTMLWDVCGVQEGQRQVCILEFENGLTKYLFQSRLAKKTIDKFIEKYLAGKLKPFIKVEDIKDNFSNNVMNLNSKTFSGLMNQDHEIFKLVYFYTDDCTKCQSIFKMVSEIADEFEGKALIVGRINMSRNEIPEMAGFKFPMLAVLRRFEDDWSSTYSDQWELQEIVEWLRKHVPNLEDSIEQYRVSVDSQNIDL